MNLFVFFVTFVDSCFCPNKKENERSVQIKNDVPQSGHIF